MFIWLKTKIKQGLFFVFLFWNSGNYPVVRILTCQYNRPDFIELQHETYQAFLKDEYEFIIFNDAVDPHMFGQIKTTCERLGIRHIPFPQELHNQPDFKCPVTEFSKRNCNIVRYALDKFGFDHNDIVALIDGDVFLVREFSIRDYLKGFDLAGRLRQGRITKYLFIGLAFLDMRTMPNKRTINFDCGWVYGNDVDSGGYTYYYLRNNSQDIIQVSLSYEI